MGDSERNTVRAIFGFVSQCLGGRYLLDSLSALVMVF